MEDCITRVRLVSTLLRWSGVRRIFLSSSATAIIAKARTYERGFPWFLIDIFTQFQEHGVDYLTALLTGYEEPPKGFELPAGKYYNKYFPNHVISMPQPISDGQIDKAAAMYAVAQKKMDDEFDKIERQMGEIIPLKVTTHVTSRTG